MTTATPAEVVIRSVRLCVIVAAIALSMAALVGCSKDETPDASTPSTSAAESSDAATDTADAEKPRKTSIIGAPIQKAEDVRDLAGEHQKQLLDQIENN